MRVLLPVGMYDGMTHNLKMVTKGAESVSQYKTSKKKIEKMPSNQMTVIMHLSLCLIFNYAYVCMWGVRGYTYMSSGTYRVHRMVVWTLIWNDR